MERDQSLGLMSGTGRNRVIPFFLYFLSFVPVSNLAFVSWDEG